MGTTGSESISPPAPHCRAGGGTATAISTILAKDKIRQREEEP
jgi:hypothetical protein